MTLDWLSVLFSLRGEPLVLMHGDSDLLEFLVIAVVAAAIRSMVKLG